MTTHRNALFAAVGALAVLGAVLGYHFYQERQEPTGLQLTIGENGISVEKK
jgi:hypothetical protein